MKRTVKIIVLLSMVLMILCSFVINNYAYTYTVTHIIDNDDAQGYSNDRYGFNTWFQANNLYYNDARKQVCNSHYYYKYKFTKYYRYSSDIYAQVSAYLYNINFTDPEANYYINDYLTDVYAPAGYINQDLAATGWNVIGVAHTTLSIPDTGFRCTDAVEVWTSENHSTKYCGADAIRVRLGY